MGDKAAMPVRTAFFGQSGVYSAASLAALLARADGEASLALIVEGPGLKRRPQRGLLWGWGQPAAKPRVATPELDLEVLARVHGVAYVWAHGGDDGGVKRALGRAGAQVGAAAGFPYLLSPSTLAAAGGVFNAHPSALPRWRGPCPLFWWLRSGEAQTAVSVHEMDDRFDGGPIVGCAPLAPPLMADGAELYRCAGAIGGALLARAIAARASNRLARRVQPRQAADLAPRPKASDGHVAPGAWRSRELARFLAGARHFVTPSFVLGGKRFFAAHGDDVVGLPNIARVPGEFAQVGDTMWLQAQDQVVSCRVQNDS